MRRLRIPVSRPIPVALLAFILSGALVSCVTEFKPPPDNPNDILIVAAYRFKEGAGLGQVLGPGFSVSNVELLLQHTSTQERIRASRHGGKGLLTGPDPAAGTYEALGLEIDISYQSKTVFGGTFRFQNRPTFDVRPGSVSNLGLFEFEVTDDGVTYQWLPDFGHVRGLFGDAYPESEWNGFNWESVSLGF